MLKNLYLKCLLISHDSVLRSLHSHSCLCVCVLNLYVCMFAFDCRYIYHNKCVVVRRQPQALVLIFYFIWHRVSCLYMTGWMTHRLQGVSCFHLISCQRNNLDHRCSLPQLALCGSQDSNSDSHACTVSVLPTVPSLWPVDVVSSPYVPFFLFLIKP